MKKTLTLAETVDQLQKDIARMEKKVAAMRRRVGAAIRKHAKLQARIANLEAAGRIVSLNKDSDILAGIDCWYVKSDSLNPDPDAVSNYYYEVTWNAEAGYGCSCESLKPCKHIAKLSDSFAPMQPTEAERAEAEAISQRLQAELVLHQAEEYTKTIEQMVPVQVGTMTVLTSVSNVAAVKDWHTTAPLHNQGFRLMR